MSAAQIELVRRFYEAWNGSDPARRCLPLLAEDFEYVNPSYAVEAGTQRGHEGWRRVIANLDSTFAFYRHEPGRMMVAENRVLCLATFRAQGRSGTSLAKYEPQLLTLRDGRIARLEWFNDDPEALSAAGL